ncbi:hypothetical protein [Pantoea phytobeneficialis]|uniref:Uncharacterized protein n=1 Tax=Pantoea phytobeneficialis TaxID=2052056 RepID=A0AAP9HAD4_9GAMM|nr:hypothetical protein [Pantoea phytobeneficialis]MDO6407511.1 hypothetical protein [Pantoea phytobeneficialis]QGR09441.1 hypothetical protein CTZ24_23495 [Pantoea phytobeneficialis]
MHSINALNLPPFIPSGAPQACEVACCVTRVSQVPDTPSSLVPVVPTERPEMWPVFIMHKAKSLLLDKSLKDKSFEEQLLELGEHRLETEKTLFKDVPDKVKQGMLMQLHKLIEIIWQKIDPDKNAKAKFTQLVLMLNTLGIRLTSADMNQAISTLMKGELFLSNARQFQIMACLYAKVPPQIIKLLSNNEPEAKELKLTGIGNHLRLLLPLQKDPGYFHAKWNEWVRAVKDIWGLTISDETAHLFCLVFETKIHQEQAGWFAGLADAHDFFYALKNDAHRPGMHWTQAWVLFYQHTGICVSQNRVRRAMEGNHCRMDAFVSKVWSKCRDMNVVNQVDMGHLYQIKFLSKITEITQEELQRTLTLLCFSFNQCELDLFFAACREKVNIPVSAKRKRLTYGGDSTRAFCSLIEHIQIHQWVPARALAILWIDSVFPSSADDFAHYLAQAKTWADKKT